jgi:DNA polymerase I
MINQKLLILDIETSSLDIETTKIKFIGEYDINKNVYKIIKYSEIKQQKKDIQDYINTFDFIITFNGEQFDLPILKNHGIIIPYWKHIDLYNVFKKRAPLLRSGGYKSYSLDNITKEIGLKVKKGEINYKIFQKNEWTEKELEEIFKYLKQDLELTLGLWEFLNDKFKPFAEFISKKDADKFKHITSSAGAFAYKVITNLLGIKDEYDDVYGNDEYEGAYVKAPLKETSRGNILYFDFASLYPMMYIHANLFSSKCDCCKQEEKWHGNETFKINGYYCSKHQGKIEELIKTLFLRRKEYKKQKDNREFALKIVLNSLYGISAKPSFKHLYSKHTASDCTALARQCISFAMDEFKNKGYEVLYADTDSCIVELKKEQNKNNCIEIATMISEDISGNFTFPFVEFNFKLEDEIKYLQFFKGNDGELNKKNYLYINKDNEITLKGLDIIKKNCSELSVLIYEKYLKEQIIKNLDCKFEKEYIDDLIKKIIKENKLIIAKQFSVKDFNKYKSKTSIYYMIREKYGEGELMLIKNYKIGVGKGIKYCSLDEAKELKIDDLNLEDVYKELSPFIRDYEKEKPIKIKKEKVEKFIIVGRQTGKNRSNFSSKQRSLF